MWHSTFLTLQGTQPPLYTASLRGRLKVVKTLLSRGSQVDQPTKVSVFNVYVNESSVLVVFYSL